MEATASVGMVRPMLAIAEPIAEVERGLDAVAACGVRGGDGLRQQHEQRDDDAHEGDGEPGRQHSLLDRR